MNLTQSIVVICNKCGGAKFKHIADTVIPEWVLNELSRYASIGYCNLTEPSVSRPWCGRKCKDDLL